MKSCNCKFLWIGAVVAALAVAFYLPSAVGGSGNLPENLALDGNCPVCLVEREKQVAGSPEYSSSYDGQTYLFPGEKQKSMFDGDPEKYVPAYGGKCVVCQVETGSAGPGKAEFFSIHDKKLFLFPSEKVKGMFDGNPGKYDKVGMGLDGNCPVCLYKGKRVKGDAKIRATYDSNTYLFPSEEVRTVFLKNPEKYVPAMGGDCAVCQVEMGKRVPGSPEYSLVHEDRLYLFPGEKQMKMFKANPGKYVSADLALDGYCAVCLASSNSLVKGQPEFSTDFKGRRYLFPNAKTRDAFKANPVRFLPADIESKLDRLL